MTALQYYYALAGVLIIDYLPESVSTEEFVAAKAVIARKFAIDQLLSNDTSTSTARSSISLSQKLSTSLVPDTSSSTPQISSEIDREIRKQEEGRSLWGSS